LLSVPEACRFTLRDKPKLRHGDGRGRSVPGPKTWSELRKYHEAVQHIRNATAHDDIRKRSKAPDYGQGTLWIPAKRGWSVQVPQVISGLRVCVAVYGTVAESLGNALGIDDLPLPRPDIEVPMPR
jgi:hypothetical protein